MAAATILEKLSASRRSRNLRPKPKDASETERDVDYEGLLRNDAMADVLFYDVNTISDRTLQMDALIEVERKIPRRGSHPSVLLVSANPLTLAVMSAQFAMYRWKVFEAQTLTEATSIVRHAVAPAHVDKNAIPSLTATLTFASKPAASALSSLVVASDKHVGRDEQQRQQRADEKGGGAVASVRSLESSDSGFFSDDEDEEDNLGRLSLSSSVCSADEQERAKATVSDEAFLRLVIVDHFTHEPFHDIVDHLRHFDRRFNLGLTIVLMLQDGHTTSSPGMLVLPRTTVTIAEAYGFGYDLVLRRSFDHTVVDFFTGLFVSAARRWNNVHHKSIIGNYRSMRHMLFERDGMFLENNARVENEATGISDATRAMISQWQALMSPISSAPGSPEKSTRSASTTTQRKHGLPTHFSSVVISDDILAGIVQPTKTAKHILRRRVCSLSSTHDKDGSRSRNTDSQDGGVDEDDDAERALEEILVDVMDENDSNVAIMYKNALARVMLELEQTKRVVELLREEADQAQGAGRSNVTNDFSLPVSGSCHDSRSDSFTSLRKEQQICFLKQRLLSVTEKLEAYETEKQRPVVKPQHSRLAPTRANLPYSSSGVDSTLSGDETDTSSSSNLSPGYMESTKKGRSQRSRKVESEKSPLSSLRSRPAVKKLTSLLHDTLASSLEKTKTSLEPQEEDDGSTPLREETVEWVRKVQMRNKRSKEHVLNVTRARSDKDKSHASSEGKTQSGPSQTKPIINKSTKKVVDHGSDNGSEQHGGSGNNFALSGSTELQTSSSARSEVSQRPKHVKHGKVGSNSLGSVLGKNDGKQTMEGGVAAKEPRAWSKNLKLGRGINTAQRSDETKTTGMKEEEQQRVAELQEEVRRLRLLLMESGAREHDLARRTSRTEVLTDMGSGDIDLMRSFEARTRAPTRRCPTYQRQKATVAPLEELKDPDGGLRDVYKDTTFSSKDTFAYGECGVEAVDNSNVNHATTQHSRLTHVDIGSQGFINSPDQRMLSPNEGRGDVAKMLQLSQKGLTARTTKSAGVDKPDLVGGELPQMTERAHTASRIHDNVSVALDEYVGEKCMIHYQAIVCFLWTLSEHHPILRDEILDLEEQIAAEQRRNGGNVDASFLMSTETTFFLRLARLFDGIGMQTNTWTQDEQASHGRRILFGQKIAEEGPQGDTFLSRFHQSGVSTNNNLSDDFILSLGGDDADEFISAEEVAKLLSRPTVTVDEIPRKLLELLRQEAENGDGDATLPQQGRVDVGHLRKLLAKIKLRRRKRREETRHNTPQRQQVLEHFNNLRRLPYAGTQEHDNIQDDAGGVANENTTATATGRSSCWPLFPPNWQEFSASPTRRHTLGRRRRNRGSTVAGPAMVDDFMVEVSRRVIEMQRRGRGDVAGGGVAASDTLPPLRERGLSHAQRMQLRRVSGQPTRSWREPRRGERSAQEVAHAGGSSGAEQGPVTPASGLFLSPEELTERIVSCLPLCPLDADTGRRRAEMPAVCSTFAIPVASSSLRLVSLNTAGGANNAAPQRLGRTSWVYGLTNEELFAILRGAAPAESDTLVFLPTHVYAGPGGATHRHVQSDVVRRMIARMSLFGSPSSLAAQRLNAQLQFSTTDWRSGVIGRSILCTRRDGQQSRTQERQRRDSAELPPGQ